jgi:hypothetical protein
MDEPTTLPREPQRLFDVTGMPPPEQEDGWPAALPSIVALLLVDVLASVWIYLNAPSWRPLLSFGNVFIVGLSTIVGLLPKADTERLGKWVQDTTVRVLSSRRTRISLIVFTILLLPFSAFRVALLLQGDGSTSATIHVIEGAQSRAPKHIVDLATLAVGRAKPSAEMRRFASPIGTPIWGYTATHATKRDGVLTPWRPVHWTYPEDFDEMVTLYVLPTTSVDVSVRLDTPRVVVKDADSMELFDIPLETKGIKASFVPNAAPIDAQALARTWMDAYMRLDPRDSATAASRVRLWMKATLAIPRRPLHLHERIFYEIRFQKAQRRGPFAVDLATNPFNLLVDSSIVSKPEVPPS